MGNGIRRNGTIGLLKDGEDTSDDPRWALPEIPEFERVSRGNAAPVSWWIGPSRVGFTTLALGQVPRMRPRAHMVPDIWLYR